MPCASGAVNLLFMINPNIKGMVMDAYISVIESIGEDLKTSIDDLIHHISAIREDLEKLKLEKEV